MKVSSRRSTGGSNIKLEWTKTKIKVIFERLTNVFRRFLGCRHRIKNSNWTPHSSRGKYIDVFNLFILIWRESPLTTKAEERQYISIFFFGGIIIFFGLPTWNTNCILFVSTPLCTELCCNGKGGNCKNKLTSFCDGENCGYFFGMK